MSEHPPVIDISHWQENVDFEAIKATGVLGVIHKATEGASNVDDRYAPRRPQAEAAGLLWGAYHFLRPGNMQQQAQHFVETAGDIDLYAADHEDTGVSLSGLKAFLAEVEKLTGKKAVIYSGHVIKEQVPDNHFNSVLAQHPLWLAHYAPEPEWPSATWPSWWLWQYSDKLKVDGVSPGTCDCNRYMGTPDELVEEWTGKEPEPEPGPEPAPAEPTVITIMVEGPATVTVVRPEKE